MKSNFFNRIILVGNGYDKFLGLPTSYSDFVLAYLKQALLRVRRDENIEGKLLKRTGKLVTLKIANKAEQNANENDVVRKIININSVKELLEESKNLIGFRSEFFSELVQYYSQKNWVDIEGYYYEKLVGFHQGVIEYRNGIDKVYELNDDLSEIRNALGSYIKDVNNHISQDEVFRKTMNLVPLLLNPLSLQERERVWENVPNGMPENVLFLNFNYTDTVDSMLRRYSSEVSSNVRIINIHGSVHMERNPIIFGYGDDTSTEYYNMETDKEYIRLLEHIKSFQYPDTSNYHNFLNFLESGPYEVFIVGHSCGMSDKTMLSTLFNNSNCGAIKNFHYRGREEDFEKRLTVSRLFSDKARMRELWLPFDPHATIK